MTAGWLQVFGKCCVGAGRSPPSRQKYHLASARLVNLRPLEIELEVVSILVEVLQGSVPGGVKRCSVCWIHWYPYIVRVEQYRQWEGVDLSNDMHKRMENAIGWRPGNKATLNGQKCLTSYAQEQITYSLIWRENDDLFFAVPNPEQRQTFELLSYTVLQSCSTSIATSTLYTYSTYIVAPHGSKVRLSPPLHTGCLPAALCVRGTQWPLGLQPCPPGGRSALAVLWWCHFRVAKIPSLCRLQPEQPSAVP